MATISDRLEAATVKAEEASDIAYKFANLGIGEYVTTASGLLPSLAEWLSNVLPTELNIYEDTTAGLAATSSGEYFFTEGGNNDIFVILYKNNGGVAEEISSVASKQAFDYLVAQVNNFPSSALNAAGFAWDPNNDTYERPYNTVGVTDIHRAMRRCLLLDNGTVNYYLDPNDSNFKDDGITPAVLDGSEGQVMVEIPLFYVRYSELSGGVKPLQLREVSPTPLPGFVPHPAFCRGGTLEKKNGMWQITGWDSLRSHIYISAYDACMWDDSAGEYVSGLNLDDMTPNIDLVNDKLSSVSGAYPLVGVTRAECRTLAANRGTGWCVTPFWVHAAVQWLYSVEYGDFKSQQVLANGNVNVSGGFPPSSAEQTDSPLSVAGKSNLIGNGSGGVDSTSRDTAWMSYRGIENFWGNCNNWVDGVNIMNWVYFVSNNPSDFADNTQVGYTQLGVAAPNSAGYISDVQGDTLSFIPSEAVGNSGSNFADYYYQNSGNRVLYVGSNASSGAFAGAFYWGANYSSADANRGLGSRLVFMA